MENKISNSEPATHPNAPEHSPDTPKTPNNEPVITPGKEYEPIPGKKQEQDKPVTAYTVEDAPSAQQNSSLDESDKTLGE